MALALVPLSAIAGSDQAGPGQEETVVTPAAPFSMSDLDLPALGEADAVPSDEQTVYLDVFFGERPTGKIAHLRLREDRLYGTPEELRGLGIVVAPDLATDEAGLLPLDSLPGLAYNYQSAEQRLVLTVPIALRPQQVLGYQAPDPIQATRGQGLVVNYDAYGTSVGGDNSLAVATAWRWFGRAGTFELTGISRILSQSNLYQRLDTRWSYSDPVRLWTWTAGDLITGALLWSRPVRLGGVQLRRNFGLRPDLITVPLPRFSGSAAVPSSVELLVNNIQQYGAEVDDGPFVLDTFPRISGAGTATLIVRDALGRSTQTTVPIYVDAQRLAPGLTDFSVEAGVLRRGFGGGLDDYDHDLVLSGSLRRGLSNDFTLEAHAESGPGLRLAGLGGVWSPAGYWGIVSASLARSLELATGDSKAGSQRTLGYQYTTQRFGLDLQSQRVSADFRDLGSLGTPSETFNSVRAQDRASFFTNFPRGSVAVTWLRVLQDDGMRDRIHTLSWSRDFGRTVSVTASAFDSDSSGLGVGVNVSMSLGPNRDVSLSVDRSEGQTQFVTALRKSADYTGGWGWELQAGDRQGKFVQATANVRGQLGEASFGVEMVPGRTGFFFQAAGGVVWMDGQAFIGRRVNDAFALVSSNGVADLPVLYENRIYGRTNARGYLLLPDLRGWQRNRIAIDPDSLGANYRMPELEALVTPADKGAVLVNFKLTVVHPAMVVLLDPAGVPVEAGTEGSIAGSDEGFMVGFDGEAYLENLSAAMVLELDVLGTTCRYHVPAAAAKTDAAIPRLGPLPCVRSNP